MQWHLAPDKAHVIVSREDAAAARLPLVLATQLWAAGLAPGSTATAATRHVLLSLDVPPDAEAEPMIIAFSPKAHDVPPPCPWPFPRRRPSWHPSPPPPWRECPIGQWFSVPGPGPVALGATLRHCGQGLHSAWCKKKWSPRRRGCRSAVDKGGRQRNGPSTTA